MVQHSHKKISYSNFHFLKKNKGFLFDSHRASNIIDGTTGKIEKCALLFVMEIFFKNEIRKVWTLSLPFCVTTHLSQYEKAWATIAWNEVVADHERIFDTE